MKKFWYKLVMFAILLTLSAGISSVAFAYDQADVISVTEQYLNAWNRSDFSQDLETATDSKQIEQYNNWQAIKEQIGEFAQIDETVVTEAEKEVTAVTTATYKNSKLTFTMIYDKETLDGYGAMYAIKDIIVENASSSSASPTMGRAVMNTIMGMGIVFIVLILISGVISLLKYVPNMIDSITGKKKKTVEILQPTENVISTIEEEEDLTDDSELAAVIMAAIAASEAGQVSVDGLFVRSIRRRR